MTTDGTTYAKKRVTFNYGSGLSQASAILNAYYYLGDHAVYAIRMGYLVRNLCNNVTLSTGLLDWLVRSWGAAVEGPLHTQPQLNAASYGYQSIDEDTTRYLFERDGYQAALTIDQKIMYPRSNALPNEFRCSISVDYQHKP